MKTILFIVCYMSVCYSWVTAQQDQAAKQILDKFAQKAQSAFPIKIGFEYTYESVIDNETYSDSGELIIAGNKYYLMIGESEIFCDGKTLWNHVVSASEVYISDAENVPANDDFFLSNPENLFSFYDNDFKYRLTADIEYMGETYHHIDLFPKDLNKSYHTITLLIHQNNYQLYSVETRGKQGINHTITISEYSLKYKVPKNQFQFDPAEYPGIEVIDTRL